MIQDQARYKLTQLTRRHLLFRWIETALVSTAISLLVLCIFKFTSIPRNLSLLISILCFLLSAIVQSILKNLFKFDPTFIVRHLNNSYPVLEESSDLLLSDPDTLSLLQRIQQHKISQQLTLLNNSIRLPSGFTPAVGLFILSIILTVGSYYLPSGKKPSAEVSEPLGKGNKAIPILPPELSTVSITVNPPLYTNLKSFTTKGLQLQFAEGSLIEWHVAFTKSALHVFAIFNGKDSVALTSGDWLSWELKKRFTESGFYQLAWQNASEQSKGSDYFKLRVVKDHPPTIVVGSPAPVTELTYSENLAIQIKANVKDDYGLKNLFIVATVAKGSGESVKFREERLKFTTPTAISGSLLNAEKTVSLKEMGMTAGDELYFYIEAADNKSPGSQHYRTETFFVTIKDTIKGQAAFASEMGVTVMPEYFRSQRQIIIDSEKLLEEQKTKKVSLSNFKKRSNDLGADQKALRLKYGQFMGEEQESGELDHDDSKDEGDNLTSKYGHSHDSQHADNDAPKDSPTNNDASSRPKEINLKEFIHNHDNGDDAAFFEQSIKAKLKAALSLMWDAELHLRLAEPAKSLPYQYRILKLLKEISNDSRAYVRRTGFDPPPVKEEKRLKGDLSDIKNSFFNINSSAESRYSNSRKAILIVESLLANDSQKITPEEKKILQQAGNELSGALIERPDIDIKILTSLRSLVDGSFPENKDKTALNEIRRIFWKIIPSEIASPTQRSQTLNSLDSAFLQNIQKAN